MKYVIILCVTVTFVSSLQLGDTNSEDPCDGLEEENKEIATCSGKKCIYKCCPLGQCLFRKQCTPCRAFFDGSLISVYDNNKDETGKTLSDVFEILPGILNNYTCDVALKFINVKRVKYTPFLIEDGILQLQMPNTFHLWTPIVNKNFCIDYFLTSKGKASKTPNFWALIPDVSQPPRSHDFLTTAMLVSCVFLVLVLIVYFMLPELQNLCGMILMAYVASLFMGFLLLAVMQFSELEDNECVILTLSIYFFLLASFCWMNVMSYDIWWTFRGYAKARPIHRRGENFKFLMYCLYAWGLPLLMAISLFILNSVNMRHLAWFVTPQIPLLGCFLEGEVKMLYLYMPMLILITCNWMFFLMTAFNIWRLSRGTAVLDSAAAGTPAAHRSQRNRLMVYLKLSVVMGVNWLFEIASFQYPDFKGWYISDVYNLLTGFLIFLIFVCKKEIYRKLYKRCIFLKGSRRFYPGSSKRSYSSTSSDSGPETSTIQICANPKGSNGYPGSIRSM